MDGENDDLIAEQNKFLSKIELLTRKETNPEIPISGLRVYRKVEPTGLTRYTHQPSVCLIAQGSKTILLGNDVLSYDRNHFLVTSIDLPIVAQVPQASPEHPYMGLAYRLEQKDIAQVLADGHLPFPSGAQSNRAMTIGAITRPLLSAFMRLLELLDEPEAIPFLAPAINREILYRLLASEGGHHLRQIGLMGSQNAQILRAVEWLKSNFAQPLLVERMADYCQMSLSAFHHRFRQVTAMSPIQYQKWLRLQEARKLMLTSDMDVTRAAFKVGYESSSQFCREYGRLFGIAPSRDIKALKQDPSARQVVAI
jgi:AraC-like DNA-binding protein